MTELVDALRALRRAVAAPVVSTGVILLGIGIGGLVALGLGWRGAAATEFVPFQVPYVISGGLVGLALLIFALGMFDVHANRVLGAQRHADTNTALREAVELLAMAPAIRDRRAEAQNEVGVRSRVKARAAQAAPTSKAMGTRKTAG